MCRSRFILLSFTLLAISAVCAYTPPSWALASKAAQETAEYVVKKFGLGLGKQTLDDIGGSLVRLSTRYGDDVLPFARVAGPKGLQLLDKVGDTGAKAILRIFQRYGAKAEWLINSPDRVNLVMKYGDDVADAMVRHPGIATDVVNKYGKGGAVALNNLDTMKGRSLVKMMVDDPAFSSLASGDQIISVVGRYGNAAMDFIWRNKGALAGTAAMAAFLRDPEPYIAGAKTLVVEPVTEIAGQSVHTVAQSVSWNWVILPLMAILFLGYGGLTLLMRIQRQWVSGRANAKLRPIAQVDHGSE
jgi:hypothetical protein